MDIAEDVYPWYALRLFTIRQKEIDEELKGKNLETFIPMEEVDFKDKTHHIRHALRPIVRNLIFVKKTLDEKEMRDIFINMPYKISVVKKNPQSADYYEISAREMHEFQVMCNPELRMKKFLTEEEAKPKKGTPVIVTHGPLKGLRGKLVRSNKAYYLLKDVPGIAVMIKVTRWCCKPIDTDTKEGTEQT